MTHWHKKILAVSLTCFFAVSLSACATQPVKPVTAHAKKNKAVATAQNGEDRPKMSLSSLQSAYERDSETPETALRYAQALRQNGRLQRAAIVLDPFIRDDSDPQNADLIAEYGAIQAAMGNYTDAEKYARKALDIDPKNGQGYHVLGIALDAEGKHDQAEIAFHQALKNWQGNPAPVLNNLGLNLAAQDFLDDAVAALRKAVSLDPDNTEIKRNLRIVTALQMQSPQTKTGAKTKPKAKAH